MSEQKQVIYIKTEMTKLPKSCNECDVICDNSFALSKKEYKSLLKQEHRPSWCPLRTEAEIADKAKEN